MQNQPDTGLSSAPASGAGSTVRVLTYNVHGCKGTDRRLDPARIAEVIGRTGAHIVGLQELDVGRRRSGGVDQAQAIAAHLNMQAHFHPAFHSDGEKYGDAILTSFPSRVVKAGPLPSIGEPRGAIWMEIDVGAARLQVINTHLGLWRRERMRQVETLLGAAWAGHPDNRNRPLIVMGDFNAVPASVPYRNLARRLDDVQRTHGRRPGATFPSPFPVLRLDHIFLGGGLTALGCEVVQDRRTRRASDHLPLLATIQL